MPRLRGISEITSAALLALIVLILGSFIVSRIFSIIDTSIREAREEVAEVEHRFRQSLGILAAYKPSIDTVNIVVSSSDYPVKLLAVYINETMWNNQCIVFSGYGVGDVEAFLLKKYSTALIRCSVPSGSLLVKLVYEGGVIEVYVEE